MSSRTLDQYVHLAFAYYSLWSNPIMWRRPVAIAFHALIAFEWYCFNHNFSGVLTWIQIFHLSSIFYSVYVRPMRHRLWIHQWNLSWHWIFYFIKVALLWEAASIYFPKYPIAKYYRYTIVTSYLLIMGHAETLYPTLRL